MKILEIIKSSPEKSELSLAAIKKAEAGARAAGGPARTYLINFRIDQQQTSLKGSDTERRAALVALIQSLPDPEKHHSTSSWIAKLHISEATKIIGLLSPAIDPAIDYLSVMEVTGNRDHIGNAKLKS